MCPRCRQLDASGNLRLSTLTREGAVLRCACGARYPVVDGIPVVVADLAAWAESEGLDALRRDADDDTLDLLVPPGSAAARNRTLARVYGGAPESPFRSWLRDELSHATGPVLELGAGLGHPGTVRLDLNHRLLRLAGPAAPLEVDDDGACGAGAGAAVVADAMDPPFPPGSFGTVCAANVLDSCRDPALLLAQADALVQPGGTLIVTCAYAFADGITPLEKRFRPETLLHALTTGTSFGGYHLDSRVQRVVDPLKWSLAAGPRTLHVHQVQAIVAHKPR